VTYHDIMRQETAIHNRTSRPGRSAINPTNPCFTAGRNDYLNGRVKSECPYMIGGDAERNWLAGWDYAASKS
jgi:ribosome modulation factor